MWSDPGPPADGRARSETRVTYRDGVPSCMNRARPRAPKSPILRRSGRERRHPADGSRHPGTDGRPAPPASASGAWPCPPVPTLVLAAIVSVLTACYPRPVDPVGVPPVPAGFERLPYVQNVSDSAAWVLWMPAPGSVAPTADSAWFRVPATGSGWLPARVEEHGGGTLRARLAPLPAGAVVEYRVTTPATSVGPVPFRTAPPAGEIGAEPVRVLVFGDSGWGGAAQLDLARHMTDLDLDLSIHVGDIAYDDGSREDFTKRHFGVYPRVFDGVPFFPSVGNHDVRADDGASYDAAFLWPEPYPGARYFTFRWGAVQFVSIDTSSDAEDVHALREGRGRQYEWLEHTLREAAEDESVRWIVTYMHHPAYSHAIGISGHEPDRDIRRVLPPLFERYGVDLAMAGHDHHYERTRPVWQGKPVEAGCGPVYVLTGGGGGTRYARDLTSSPLLAFGRRAYEFVELRFEDERIRGRAVDREGETMDEFAVSPFAGAPAGPPEGCRP